MINRIEGGSTKEKNSAMYLNENNHRTEKWKGERKGYCGMGALWLLEKDREKMIIRGPLFISNYKPQVALNGTYLETMHQRKLQRRQFLSS